MNQEGGSAGSEPRLLFSGAMNKQLKVSLQDGRGLLKPACQLPQSPWSQAETVVWRDCGVKEPWCEGTLV